MRENTNMYITDFVNQARASSMDHLLLDVRRKGRNAERKEAINVLDSLKDDVWIHEK
jgi:hypothetical protein